MKLSTATSYRDSVAMLDTLFSLPDNFGIVRREFTLGGHEAVLYFAEGLNAGSDAEHILAYCMNNADTILPTAATAEAFCAACIPYAETETAADTAALYAGVASGCLLLLCAPFPTRGILVKNRNVPARSLEEPEHDKVLRGAHIGFIERIQTNCAMLRRLLPDPSLVMKRYAIGVHSQTTVVVCYLRGKADEQYLAYLDGKLSAIKTDAMALGTQSLAECLVKTRVWNPFPRFRYTERPDAAAASLCEGSVLVFCDNAPQAMILPVSLFSFLQETNDFYLAPFTGTYLRLLRLCSFVICIYLTPVWYALVTFTKNLPPWLSFLRIEEAPVVPILAQLILIELSVDALKLASMNTPSALSNSLSVIGGLILGDFAIQTNLFMPETILYMSVVSIMNFTQHNYELGYAFKYTRIAILLLTAVFGWWGIAIGTALLLFLVVTVPAPEEKSRYFYPLFPFDGAALASLFIRKTKKST